MLVCHLYVNSMTSVCYSRVLVYHLFIYSFIYLFIHLFTHLFIYLFMYSFTLFTVDYNYINIHKRKMTKLKFFKRNLSTTTKKHQSVYPRLAMNERQILQWQGKLCICFVFDLKRTQISGPLKAIVLIPYFIEDLCSDDSILGFLKS